MHTNTAFAYALLKQTNTKSKIIILIDIIRILMLKLGIFHNDLKKISILPPCSPIWFSFHFIQNGSRFDYYRIYFDPDIPANDYIRSHSFFKHPDYTSHENPGDIGLIKLESPIDSRDMTRLLVNIICLPIRGFRLKGSQIAKIAGSGPGLDRVKTGSTRVMEIPNDHLNQEKNDFGFKICKVSSFSLIYLVQWMSFWKYPRLRKLTISP